MNTMLQVTLFAGLFVLSQAVDSDASATPECGDGNEADCYSFVGKSTSPCTNGDFVILTLPYPGGGGVVDLAACATEVSRNLECGTGFSYADDDTGSCACARSVVNTDSWENKGTCDDVADDVPNDAPYNIYSYVPPLCRCKEQDYITETWCEVESVRCSLLTGEVVYANQQDCGSYDALGVWTARVDCPDLVCLNNCFGSNCDYWTTLPPEFAYTCDFLEYNDCDCSNCLSCESYEDEMCPVEFDWMAWSEELSTCLYHPFPAFPAVPDTYDETSFTCDDLSDYVWETMNKPNNFYVNSYYLSWSPWTGLHSYWSSLTNECCHTLYEYLSYFSTIDSDNYCQNVKTVFEKVQTFTNQNKDNSNCDPILTATRFNKEDFCYCAKYLTYYSERYPEREGYPGESQFLDSESGENGDDVYFLNSDGMCRGYFHPKANWGLGFFGQFDRWVSFDQFSEMTEQEIRDEYSKVDQEMAACAADACGCEFDLNEDGLDNVIDVIALIEYILHNKY